MSTEALRQGYKVGYSDLGIDESKELALTLTNRGGLWAGAKVDQLCQASGSTLTVALDVQHLVQHRRRREQVNCASANLALSGATHSNV